MHVYDPYGELLERRRKRDRTEATRALVFGMAFCGVVLLAAYAAIVLRGRMAL